MPDNLSPDDPTEVMMEQLQPKTMPPLLNKPAMTNTEPHRAVTDIPPPSMTLVREPAPSVAYQPAVVEEGEIRKKDEALGVKFTIGKISDYLQWFVTVLEVILAIRFVLKLFGATPGNPFASFIFALTQIPLALFYNILPPISWNPPNQAIEFSTLFAMAIYLLIFLGLKRFLSIMITDPGEAE